MNRPIISKEQLIKAGGQLRYEAGLKAFETCTVKQFQGNDKQASGKVCNGDEDYDVTIRYRAGAIEGSCHCEESDGFDFCNHCVQLCLHANKVVQQLVSLSKGPDKSKVLAYLINLDKQVLAKQFLEIIEDDNELFQRYLLRASLDGQALNYTELKSRITSLTKLNEKLFSQRQVKHFFTRIERLLDELIAFPLDGEEEKVLKLCEYAFIRINALLDKLEDRSNQRQAAVEQLNQLYQKLFPSLTGRPETLAKRFFKTWLADTHQLCLASFSVIEYNKPLLAEFNKLVQAEDKAAAQSGSLNPLQLEKVRRYQLDRAIEQDDPHQIQHYRTLLDR